MGWFICVAGALASLAASAIAQSEPVTIKARLHHNRFILPATINGLPLHVLADTACTIPTLHPGVIDELKIQSSGTVRIVGIAGEERAPTYRGVALDLGGAQYRPRRVASIASEREESRRRRDGVIGSGFFERFVVEMDWRAGTVRLHSPTNFSYTGKGEIVPLRFSGDIPVIDAALVFDGKEPVSGAYEVDTGCDSGLCLGEKFVREQKLLESVKSRADEKFGVGGSVETRNASVPHLRIGKLDVPDAQADFFQSGSPVDEPRVGHIGMGVLHRYRVIFDYSRKRMIMEPY